VLMFQLRRSIKTHPGSPGLEDSQLIVIKMGSQQDHYDLCLPRPFLLHSREHFRDVIPYPHLGVVGGGLHRTRDERLPSHPHQLHANDKGSKRNTASVSGRILCVRVSAAVRLQARVRKILGSRLVLADCRGFPHCIQVNA
jgi:hypothetical protein